VNIVFELIEHEFVVQYLVIFIIG